MSTITLLTGDEPSSKLFPKPKYLKYPTFHEYDVLEINSLQDIKDIIETNRGNPHNYFIRGVPHTVEAKGYRRKKIYTTDTPLNWIMIDIDGWVKDKPLKEKLIDLLPFIREETAILIDYSSKEGLYGGGEDYRDKYYVHVYLWCDTALTSQDLKDRLIQYKDFIDCQIFHVVQAHYFSEPTLLEDYQTKLTERTILIDGNSISIDDVPLPKISTTQYKATAHKGVKSTTLEEAFEEFLKPSKRHVGLHTFFCKVVSRGTDQQYWINRYWKDYRRSKDHDSILKVNDAMEDAKEYVYRKFTSHFEPRFSVVHLDEENLKEVMNYELGQNYLIKSGQMTWKTQSLKNIPTTIIENGVERPTRLWIVGHRVNLIRQICEELNLKLYCDLPEHEIEIVDNEEFKSPYPLWKENRLGITFDSFWRTFNEGKAPEVDYFVLDESEQVINELLTTTRTQERSPGFEHKRLQPTSVLRSNIGRAIQSSKSVIAMDADLGNTTQWFIEDYKSDNFRIFDNKYKSLDGRTIKLLPSLPYSLDLIEEEVAEGKLVYINCDSRIKAEAIHKHLETIFDPPSQRGGRMAKGFIIHGGNSSLKKHQEIARKPNEKIPELIRRGLRWLITTPVFETGLSIGTNELHEYRFNSAFALWTINNYTANTLRQAINRVRNADNYYVFIPNKWNEAVDISKILDFVEQQRAKPRPVDRTEYLKRYVEQQKKNSQANKIIHFQFLMEDIGAVFERIDKDSAVGSSAWNSAVKAITEERAEKILKATDVKDEEEYQALGFMEADQFRRWKYEVQQAFATREISKRLIKRWDCGRIEQKWKLRQLLQKNVETLEQVELKILQCDSKQAPFVHGAFTRVFDDFGISPEQHRETEKTRLFIEQHTNAETLDWLCGDDVLIALKEILKWHGLELSEVKKLKAEPLRLYAKLASLACYSVTHFGAYDGRLKTGAKIKINDLIREYKKRGMYEEIPKEKVELNKTTQEILEKRIIARADDLSVIEENFYRARHPHLILKDYEPIYSDYFGKNLSNGISHIGQELSDKKIRPEKALAGAQIC